MKKLYVVIIGLILNVNGFGQEWEWVKRIYADEVFNDKVGNLYFFGHTKDNSGLFKCNSQGDVIWTKPLGSLLELQVNNDGYIFILDHNYSLTKLDSSGKLIWTRSVNNLADIIVGDNFLYGLGQTITQTDSGNVSTAYLSQFSFDGALLWKKDYPGTSYPERFISVNNDTVYFINSFYSGGPFGYSLYMGQSPNKQQVISGNTSSGYKTGTCASEIIQNKYYVYNECYWYGTSKLKLSDDNGNLLWNIAYPRQSNELVGSDGKAADIKKSADLNFYISYSVFTEDGPTHSEISEMNLQGNVLNSIFLKNVYSRLSFNSTGIYVRGSYIKTDTARLGSYILLPDENNFFLAKFKSFPTGIAKENQKNKLSLSPNPSSGKFQIQLKEEIQNKESKVCVFDVMGRCVYSSNFQIGKSSNPQIDLSGNAKGIYFVEVSAGEERFREKIIIQ
jgi:hypothetical protein